MKNKIKLLSEGKGIKEHKHIFKLGGFSNLPTENKFMYLYCKCGAVEKVTFGNYGDIYIYVKENKL